MKINTAEIKARVSLQELMRQDGHKLVMNGGLLKCLCPFHKEKSPSCCVYPDGHFYCFGCHASGDVIGYVMRRDGIKFVEACEKLSGAAPVFKFNPKQFAPIPLRETPPLAGAESLIKHWKNQTTFSQLYQFSESLGVSTSSLQDMDVCWAMEHNAWAFPMLDHTGTPVGIRLRDENGRKWAVKGSKEGLFFSMCHTQKTVWICEGPTDAAAGITLGLAIVGRPSCQGAVKELVKLIKTRRFKDVVIISDNDAPGLAGSERLQEHLTVPYRELVLPCKDLREFLKLGGTRQLLESMAEKQIPQRRPRK